MKIEGELARARFVKRLNRFEAIAELEGVQQLVHVPNTGRLKELLVEGALVVLKKFDNSNRKTRLGLLLVKKDDVWVSIDSANVPNRIVHEALLDKRFEQFRDYSGIRREVTLGNSRFDFGLFKENCEYYIEVKGVTLVESGKAFFPDAPTERGTRHLEELTRLRLDGKGAGVIFIVQREDADEIRPNDRTDRAFGAALRKACESGVDLQAFACKIDVDLKRIDIDRRIPVIL